MNTLRSTFGLSIEMILIGAAFLGAASAQDRRIAVYDFDSRTAEVALRGRVPQAFNLGHQASSQIMAKLVNSNTHFEVIERADIERILKEQGRKYDERFDPGSAAELGRLLNVDGIVLGEVTSANATVSDSNMKVFKKLMGAREAKAKVHIMARLISTQTGTIQVMQEADGEGTDPLASSLSGVSSESQGDIPSALSEALTKALAKAAASVSQAIITRAAALPPIQHPGAPLQNSASAGGGPPVAASGERLPVVNSVDGTKVYIEGGQELKISVGERYDVRTITKEITLSNGQKQPIRERVETVVIEDVQGALSIAHVEGGQPSRARPGDVLQKASSLPPLLQGPPPPPTRSSVPTRKFLPGNPQ